MPLFNISDLLDKLNTNDQSNQSSLDKSKGSIMTYGGGVTHPLLSFKSLNLTNENKSKLQSKLRFTNEFKNSIKTSQYKSFRTVNQALAKINPIEQPLYRNFTTAQPEGLNADTPQYENIFSPSANILVNMNNYRFKYTNKILTHYTRVKNPDNKDEIAKIYTELDGTPSLFNPIYAIQTVGIMPRVPLLNTEGFKNRDKEVEENLTDCSIRELVRLSHIKNSVLGLATYRYADFMYCRDVGKISNNHLITLRRFPIPIGDNIFEYYDDSPGDIGRLVTWFDNEENKLEDIMKYEYKATWKELHAERQDIESKEEDQARGPFGMFINSTSPTFGKRMAEGIAGGNHIFKKLGLNTNADDAEDRKQLLRQYDKNKVYTPPNTIQDTHVYEGKLEFTHEFTLTFNYVLRAYDNINPRSAMLDLIANILNVTYKRGVFWGGERRIIGPRTNTAAWTKATAMIDGAWKKGGQLLTSISSGQINAGDIFGMIGSMLKNLFKGGVEAFKNATGIGSGGENDPQNAANGTMGKIGMAMSNLFKSTGLDSAALGVLKNTLGRPAVYAMDSLLTGDDVGLWHVTIGNPKNPIMAMGNLILTNASIQHYGPLGIDDFPTNIKLTVTLKHARSRDSVDIARMYTSGTNGIYYPIHNKDINTVFPNYMNSDFLSNSNILKQDKMGEEYVYTPEAVQTTDGKGNTGEASQKLTEEKKTVVLQSAGEYNMNVNNRIKELKNLNAIFKDDKGIDVKDANINSPYAAQIDHTNQRLMYDLAIVLDEIA